MASEIRVDKINSLSGVGTVTLSPTGVDIAGITTAATLRATTGIVTSLTAVSSAKVGSGITLSSDGDIFATGITTVNNQVHIPDYIHHVGDTNCKFGFESGDTFSVETAGSERVRVDSSGRLLLGAGAIATPKSSGAGSLDLDNGSISLVVGGNENSTGRTDGTNKINRVVIPHYTNAEEPMAMISGYSTSGASQLFYGGGSGLTNAVTEHNFYTTANTTTTSGTKRLRIRSNGEIQIGSIDTPSASRGALAVKASNDAQSVGINFYLQEVSGGEGYGIGVDGDGDLNFYNGGATSPTFEIKDNDHIKITSGNLEFASGSGIDFSAVSDGSRTITTDGNKFDDYEEGTFTPTLEAASNPSVSYTNQGGKYTKIGNLVYITVDLRWSGRSGGSGNAKLGSLPFTSSSSQPYTGGIVFEKNKLTSHADEAIISLEVGSNSSFGTFLSTVHDDSASTSGLVIGNFQDTSGYFMISFNYFTN